MSAQFWNGIVADHAAAQLAVAVPADAPRAGTPITIPDQVRGALQFLASDTRCSERERAALRDLGEHGTDPVLARLRGLLR